MSVTFGASSSSFKISFPSKFGSCGSLCWPTPPFFARSYLGVSSLCNFPISFILRRSSDCRLSKPDIISLPSFSPVHSFSRFSSLPCFPELFSLFSNFFIFFLMFFPGARMVSNLSRAFLSNSFDFLLPSALRGEIFGIGSSVRRGDDLLSLRNCILSWVKLWGWREAGLGPCDDKL